MHEQCCVLLVNNTDLCSLLFTPHVPTKKKEIKFLRTILYEDFFFFAPFPALIHVEVHVFPWPTHLETHLSQLTVVVSLHQNQNCSKTVHKKGTNTWNLSITWQKNDTKDELWKNSFLLRDIAHSFLTQWTNLMQTDLVEENRTWEKIDQLDGKKKILKVVMQFQPNPGGTYI